MGLVLPYILKVGLALAVGSLLYFLWIKRNASFLFSRYYLLCTLGLSFGLPLISFPVYMAMPVAPTAVVQTLTTTAPASEGWPWWSLVFWAGVVASWLHTLVSHLRLHWLLRSALRESHYGQEVWVIKREIAPFSYFRKIVIPAHLLDSPHLESVVRHEAIHARQGHCVDLYFTAIICALQWFNPFAWLLRKAVKDNLEFLTDAKVIRHLDAYTYKMGLVALAGRTRLSPFPSISGQKQLKQRIMMMQNTRTNSGAWKRLWILIPVLGLVSFSLSGRTVIWTQTPQDLKVQNDSTTKLKKPILVVDGERQDEWPPFENVESVSVLKGTTAVAIYGEEAKHGAIIMITKKTTDSSQIIVREASSVQSIYRIVSTDDTKEHLKPLYIVNGEKYEGQPPAPENITSITVLKGAAAAAIYGEKAKHGAILIATREKNQ